MIIHAFRHDISAPYRTVKPHDCGNSPIYLFCGFFLICFDVACRVGSDEDIVHHPSQDRVAAVCDLLFKHKFHQFLCRRTHIFKSLPERNNGKSHIFEILHHLDSAPAVKSDLTDIETLTEPFNEFLDIAVMHHISLCGLQKSLPFPDIIRHMVTADTQFKGIFGYPEIRQDHIFIIFIKRRKDKHKRCNIRSR